MFENEYVECALPAQKSIALIAHDNKKKDMVEWCMQNKKILEHHFLCGTGTTAKLVSDRTGLPVRGYNSGPLGGDQQIGAMLANGELDLIIFLRDPLTAQPHEPDVSALFRLCDVHNIPLATNVATAEVLIHGLERGDLDWRNIVNPKKNINF